MNLKKTITSGLALACLSLGLVTGSASAAPSDDVTIAGYETCPWGKVCLYTGWGGSGIRWEAPGCGWRWIPVGLRNKTKSVRTYGNGVNLHDTQAGDAIVGSVGPGTATNLAGWEADRADRVFVFC